MQVKPNTQPKVLTDSEKLDILNERLRKIQRNSNIQTLIVIAGFVGIISVGALLQKGKKLFKDSII